ncbi:hypothetical protein Tco_1202862 [Tanacetum coccineum]
MIRVGNLIYFQDYEWYEGLEDGDLKEENLKEKAILEGSWGHKNRKGKNLYSWLKESFGNYHELDYELMLKLEEYWWGKKEEEESSEDAWSNYLPRDDDDDDIGDLDDYLIPKDAPYYVDVEEEGFKERRSKLLGIPYMKPPMFKSEKFEVINYSFRLVEEYVAIREYDYDIWVSIRHKEVLNVNEESGGMQIIWNLMCVVRARIQMLFATQHTYPLIRFLTPRDILREGYNIKSCVADIITNGAWNWPQSWLLKALNLSSIAAPNLISSQQDSVCWKDSKGKVNVFSVKLAWEELRTHGTKVWNLVHTYAELDSLRPILNDIVIWLQPLANSRSFKDVVGKLIVAASSYFIWNEQNNRLFNNTRRSPEEVRDLIIVTVRLKLVTFRFKTQG